jgi:hypothetical protein
MRKILRQASIILQNALGIDTKFVMADSVGVVSVVYTIWAKEIKIQVSVDMNKVKKDEFKEAIILNELSANYFDRYGDSNGLLLVGNFIGTWDEIFAEEASFIDSRNHIFFTLKKVEGTRMFRGRELVTNRLAWSGLAYVLPWHRNHLTYDILIGLHE